jgi:asparagine synthase (glutamine-hydrolysing)
MSVGPATIVYNGESYNFRELRRELERDGRIFVGGSDTEVLLHAYDAWGLDGLSRLEGIFSFALWDSRRRRLVLMRDRLGVKPLFYAWSGEQLAFGSEIKAVLAGLDIDRSIDDQALSEYLWYGNAFEDRTIYRNVRALEPGHQLIVEEGDARIIYRNIRALEPGHQLIVDDDGARINAWWRIEQWLPESPPRLDAGEAASSVRDIVDRAVARQLMSDVPVGIFLSGGVDSSSISASAALASKRQLSSYSVGFDFVDGVQELDNASRIANKLGLDHHELHISGGALDEVIMALVRAHDEPFGDAANIPLYLLGQELGGSIKVVLQGDGGDEMFAGYRRYAVLRHATFWRLWSRAIEYGFNAIPGRSGARFARFAAAAGHRDPAMRMALLLTMESLRDPPTAMLTEEARESLERNTDPFAAYRRCASRFADAEPVQQMLLTDISLQLPSQFLTKVDRATMANGIEARVPLLDEQIASFAVGLPTSLKVRGTEKKIVLREAMRGRLPNDILDGPKTGFGVPYSEWLRSSLYDFARAAVLDARFLERFRLDRTSLENTFDVHRSGRRDRGFLLWKMLQLSLWSREYLS